MTASFRQVLILRMAKIFAISIAKSNPLFQALDQEEQKAYRQARSIDGIEDYPEKLPEGSWATSRRSRNWQRDNSALAAAVMVKSAPRHNAFQCRRDVAAHGCRIDFDKYGAAISRGLNLICLPQGGVTLASRRSLHQRNQNIDICQCANAVRAGSRSGLHG
jgi:hypothetical protein